MEALDCEVTVKRNNEISIDEIAHFDKIVLSPGPGLPNEAGIMMDVIANYAESKPIFGVCLGMQAIGVYFGGTLYNQSTVKHGIAEKCYQTNPSLIYQNVPPTFEVGLYHSWAVSLENVDSLIETSVSENQILMSLEHKKLPIYGVQFHPESLMTIHGKTILENFLKLKANFH